MKASELAYAAAREMSERGHCKRIPEDNEGRVCLYGAINYAEGGTSSRASFSAPLTGEIFNMGGNIPFPNPLPYSEKDSPEDLKIAPVYYYPTHVTFTYAESEERQALYRMLRQILCERGITCEFPHQWNDRDDVTGEDVILLFKEAGARLEAEDK